MDSKGNQWYSYDMTGGTELDVVTLDGLTKVTSDTVMTWRDELSWISSRLMDSQR